MVLGHKGPIQLLDLNTFFKKMSREVYRVWKYEIINQAAMKYSVSGFAIVCYKYISFKEIVSPD